MPVQSLSTAPEIAFSRSDNATPRTRTGLQVERVNNGDARLQSVFHQDAIHTTQEASQKLEREALTEVLKGAGSALIEKLLSNNCDIDGRALKKHAVNLFILSKHEGVNADAKFKSVCNRLVKAAQEYEKHGRDGFSADFYGKPVSYERHDKLNKLIEGLLDRHAGAVDTTVGYIYKNYLHDGLPKARMELDGGAMPSPEAIANSRAGGNATEQATDVLSGWIANRANARTGEELAELISDLLTHLSLGASPETPDLRRSADETDLGRSPDETDPGRGPKARSKPTEYGAGVGPSPNITVSPHIKTGDVNVNLDCIGRAFEVLADTLRGNTKFLQDELMAARNKEPSASDSVAPRRDSLLYSDGVYANKSQPQEGARSERAEPQLNDIRDALEAMKERVIALGAQSRLDDIYTKLDALTNQLEELKGTPKVSVEPSLQDARVERLINQLNDLLDSVKAKQEAPPEPGDQPCLNEIHTKLDALITRLGKPESQPKVTVKQSLDDSRFEHLKHAMGMLSDDVKTLLDGLAQPGDQSHLQNTPQQLEALTKQVETLTREWQASVNALLDAPQLESQERRQQEISEILIRIEAILLERQDDALLRGFESLKARFEVFRSTGEASIVDESGEDFVDLGHTPERSPQNRQFDDASGAAGPVRELRSTLGTQAVVYSESVTKQPQEEVKALPARGSGQALSGAAAQLMHELGSALTVATQAVTPDQVKTLGVRATNEIPRHVAGSENTREAQPIRERRETLTTKSQTVASSQVVSEHGTIAKKQMADSDIYHDRKMDFDDFGLFSTYPEEPIGSEHLSSDVGFSELRDEVASLRGDVVEFSRPFSIGGDSDSDEDLGPLNDEDLAWGPGADLLNTFPGAVQFSDNELDFSSLRAEVDKLPNSEFDAAGSDLPEQTIEEVPNGSQDTRIEKERAVGGAGGLLIGQSKTAPEDAPRFEYKSYLMPSEVPEGVTGSMTTITDKKLFQAMASALFSSSNAGYRLRVAIANGHNPSVPKIDAKATPGEPSIYELYGEVKKQCPEYAKALEQLFGEYESRTKAGDKKQRHDALPEKSAQGLSGGVISDSTDSGSNGFPTPKIESGRNGLPGARVNSELKMKWLSDNVLSPEIVREETQKERPVVSFPRLLTGKSQTVPEGFAPYKYDPSRMPSTVPASVTGSLLAISGAADKVFFGKMASALVGSSPEAKKLRAFIERGNNPAECKADVNSRPGERSIYEIYSEVQKDCPQFAEVLEKRFSEYELRKHTGTQYRHPVNLATRPIISLESFTETRNQPKRTA
ncbi:hypothetical protein RBU55_18460 [Pseudomonas chlororaphis subsp. aurantiaca]|uniref:hypothetical protein n=1 Tax=Pseudomonas chlororaphis TaxID=587753 RepID=UPI0027DE8F33|nr:hypothetical protein [Pseudomonas chlororaphis]WMI97549.1 hypothetical protein RBU55_18460 [Pseudomonas chlororaphis subsp. aurantiaca]